MIGPQVLSARVSVQRLRTWLRHAALRLWECGDQWLCPDRSSAGQEANCLFLPKKLPCSPPTSKTINAVKPQPPSPLPASKPSISPAPDLSSVVGNSSTTHITLPRCCCPRKQCRHVTVDIPTAIAAGSSAAAAAAVSHRGVDIITHTTTATATAAAFTCRAAGRGCQAVTHLPGWQCLPLLQQLVICPVGP